MVNDLSLRLKLNNFTKLPPFNKFVLFHVICSLHPHNSLAYISIYNLQEIYESIVDIIDIITLQA